MVQQPDAHPVRIRRITKNLTQLALARTVKLSPSRLCLIERRQAEPTLQEAKKLARALGAPLGDLFPQFTDIH